MGHHATGTVFWGYDLGDLINDAYEFIGPDWLNPDEDGDEASDAAVVLGTALGADPTDYAACLRAAKSHPVELGYYGHTDGETLHRVAVKASERKATYECIALPDLTVERQLVGADWPDQIDRFMDLMGLPVPDHEPGWFLTSDYG